MEPNQNQIKPSQQELASIPEEICKKCNVKILGDYYFCPNCGLKLKETPFKFSLISFIGNSLLSILLPPLGIFPGIKNLKNPDIKAKTVGIIYIVLTILVSLIMIKFFMDYINSMNKMLNDTNLLNNYINSPQGSMENQIENLQSLER